MTASPSGRITTRNPSPWTATYAHPSGLPLAYVQLRLLVLNEVGEYSVDQEGNTIPMSISLGDMISIPWVDTGFEVLEWSTDYAVEWRLVDTLGNSSGWIGRTYFNTNRSPEQGSIVSPRDYTAFTGYPLVSFDVSDPDDEGGAWFLNQDNLIYEWKTTFGVGLGQTQLPMQVAYDQSGVVYVADFQRDVWYKFDSSGVNTFISTLHDQIRGITVDPINGDIYVSWLTNLKRMNSAGTQIGSTFTQAGVTFDRLHAYGENLYVTRTDGWVGRYRITTTGTSLTPFGSPGTGPGNFVTPRGITYTTLRDYVDGALVETPVIYVVDAGNYRVQCIHALLAIYLFEFGEYGANDGQFLNAQDITVDPLTGNVWVTDSVRHDIQVFSRFGDFIYKRNRYGTANDQWYWPLGIDINKEGTKLLLSDYFAGVVKQFTIPAPETSVASHLAGEVEVSGPYADFGGGFDSTVNHYWTSESDVGWTVNGVIDSAEPRSGAGALKHDVSVASSSGSFRYIQNGLAHPYLLPVVPGRVYTAKGWFKRNRDLIHGSMSIRWLLANGTQLLDDSYGIRVGRDNTWTEASVARAAPSDAAYAQIILRLTKNAVATSTQTINAANPVYGWWDDVTFGGGARYVRAGVFGDGTRFTYQPIATDFPIEGTYKLRARGRDANSEGPWSAPITIKKIAGITAVVLSPSPGQVVDTASPLIAWIITLGTQWRWRVQILVAATGEIAYDSDWTQDATTRSHFVPPGYLEDGGEYLAQVWIDIGEMEVII
jgi:hypothetical protein